MINIQKQLNASQWEAVRSTEGPLIVYAGAGSGKTRVITYRIAYLITECAVSPNEIFATTFTNKAAGVMRNRIREYSTRTSNAVPTWLGTFHSLGCRILRREMSVLGRDTDFIIIDDNDQKRILKHIIKELDFTDDDITPAMAKYFINRMKDNAPVEIDFSVFSSPKFPALSEILERVWKQYKKQMINENNVDFADLIYLPVVIFRGSPEIQKKYSDRFRYILVDEFQDTNRSQYELVRVLASSHKNICVVGDEDQCIYEWRGANYKNIIDYMNDFSPVKKIKLETNYRSVRTILDMANMLIRHNTERSDKTLVPARKTTVPDTKPMIHYTPTGTSEAAISAEYIKKWSSVYNIPLSQIAVFYRVNSQSRVLESALRKYRIPYQIIAGTAFFERKEIKDILAYLRFVVNPAADTSLRRIINTPERGIGKKTKEYLETVARKNNISLFKAFTVIDKPSVAEKLNKFRKIITEIKDYASGKRLSEVILKIYELTGYVSRLEKIDDEDSLRRLSNLQELITAAVEFEDGEKENASISNFLERVALISDVDSWDEKTEKVSLMTLHTAKGLEFSCVIIVGVEEGILPHIRSIEDRKSIEEERRLLYVGITRARDYLVLISARQRQIYGRTVKQVPSKFLREMLREEQEEKSETFQPSGEDITAGRWVRDPKFGRGKILKKTGSNEKTLLTILFKDGTKRVFMLKYARLEFL